MNITFKNAWVGYLAFVVFLLNTLTMRSQNEYLQGPENVVQGELTSYYLLDDYEDIDEYTIMWFGSTVGGDMEVFSTDYLWNNAGSDTVEVEFESNGDYYMETINVTVSSPQTQQENEYLQGPKNATQGEIAHYYLLDDYEDIDEYSIIWNTNGNIQGDDTEVFFVDVLWTSTIGNNQVIAEFETNGDYYEEIIDVNVGGNQNSGQSNQNYTHTVYYQEPFTESELGNATNAEKIETIAYFDGIGRPIQTIGIRAGGNEEDIITHIEYDEYGRQTKDYLPYASTGNRGEFSTGAEIDVLNYYDAAKYDVDFPGMTVATINPYSEKRIEKSPLNRVFEQTAPGDSWQFGNSIYAGKHSSGHTIKFDYQTNTNTEVRLYSVDLFFGNNIYAPTLAGGTNYYVSGQLYKYVTMDENFKFFTQTHDKDHTTEEFKDKQGRIILKRTYNNNVAHDTYYVYDDYGNLTYVLPPKSEAHVNRPNNSELEKLCYQYKYDHRNRLVEKKIPGKDWEYIVYNKLNQPILTQDANQRVQNKWLFTKYDAFGRVAYTGETTRNISRINLQAEVNNTAQQYVTKQTTATTIDGTTIYYNNAAYPTSNITEVHTINYYDNYTFDTVSGNLETAYGITPIINAKGLPTGSKIRVLDTNHWITTVNYYDTKSRPIYVYSHNPYLETTDKVKSKFDFVGKIDETTSTHAKTGFNTITTVDTYTYDHQGRLLTHNNKINALTEETIAENTYDELGQLTSKGVGGTGTNRLQDINYTYNIRGWLKQINDPSSLGNDLFAFKIGYDEGANPLYNGNISLTQWKTANTDTSLKTYNYSYDALNRIAMATDNTNNYSLSAVAYDKNGNITSLKRRGHTNSAAASFGVMDDLTYSYDIGNKLLKVSDKAPIDQLGFKDDAVNTATDSTNDYTYDSNGNMIKDENKSITAITYNHLNLPKQVSINGNGNHGYISYIYDAAGIKLRKLAVNSNTGLATITEYAGNYVYENEILKFFNHPEGYVEPIISVTYPKGGKGSAPIYTITDIDYVYQYKDHLGNVRLSYKDNNGTLDILEENSYYPFGLKHKGYNGNVSANINSIAKKFKYNGVEYEDALGLNLYEMKYRHYDPAIGRWLLIDPRVENLYALTPYNAFLNDPIRYSDPDGDIPPQLIAGLIGAAWEYGSQVYDNYQNGDSGFDAWVGNVDFADVATEGVATGLTLGLNKVPGANVGVTAVTELVKSSVDIKGNGDVDVIGVSENKQVGDVLIEATQNTGTALVAGKVADKVLGGVKNQVTKAVKNAIEDKGNAYKNLSKANNIRANGNASQAARGSNSATSNSRFKDVVKADEKLQSANAASTVVNSQVTDKAVGEASSRATKSTWESTKETVKNWWNSVWD